MKFNSSKRLCCWAGLTPGNNKSAGKKKELIAISVNSIALTIDEAFKYEGIERNTLRQLIAWHKIPTLYIGIRNYIILVTADIPEDYCPLDLICKKPNGS